LNTAIQTEQEEKSFEFFSSYSFNSADIKKEINEDGFLVHFDVPIARTGGFEYNKYELAFLFDENTEPYKKINVYRGLESFSDEVLNKNKIVPFTNNHPKGGVHIDNANYTIVGDVYGLYAKDNILYAGGIITRDKDTINDIETGGKKEVSIGFEGKYILKPQTIDGVSYDGLEKIVRINHLSLVNEGKAGSAFKMHAKQEDIPMSEKTFKTDFDGIEVDLPYEKLAEVQNSKFTKLEKQIQIKNSESEDRLTKMETMLNAIMQKVTKNADDEDKKDDKKDDDSVENSDDEDEKEDKEMSKNGISNNSVSEILKRRKPAQLDKLVVNTMDYPFLANQSHYIVSNESAADFEVSPSAVLVSLRNYVTQQ